MKKTLLSAAIVAGLGIASASQAAVVMTAISKGTPVSGATTLTGYTGYVIHLSSDQGLITAVDVSTGNNGITGGLVQRWSSSEGDGTYNTKTVQGTAQNVSTTALNFDSHLIPFHYVGEIDMDESVGTGTFPASGSAANGLPTNQDGFGYALSVNGFVKGSFGIDGAFETTGHDLAYIVIKTPTTPDPVPVGFALVATSGGPAVQVPLIIPGTPEPTTLGLAGVAAAGLLGRRRRA